MKFLKNLNTPHLIILSHPLFYFQKVCELAQLFYNVSSDHSIPSSTVSRKYVNLVNCFKTYHLIIPLHPFQDVCELDQLFYDFSFLSHPLQDVREFEELFEHTHLITPSHLSSESM